MATRKTKPAAAKPKPATGAAPAAATAAGAPAPATDAPMPKVVKVTEPVLAERDLKKRELIDLVVERSGIKRKDAKPAVEAMLAVLGETLTAGRELNLQPLGKLRINRVEEKGNGRVIVCKLRQSATAVAEAEANIENRPQDPLADAAE